MSGAVAGRPNAKNERPPALADLDPNAQPKYTPLPKANRRGIGLCLSGGGFRPTLFHMGAPPSQRLTNRSIPPGAASCLY